MFPERTRILVVDDMPKMRQIITSQIKSLGFVDVINASDGKEALNVLNEEYSISKKHRLNSCSLTGICLSWPGLSS